METRTWIVTPEFYEAFHRACREWAYSMKVVISTPVPDFDYYHTSSNAAQVSFDNIYNSTLP